MDDSMEKKHPLNDLMWETMAKIREMVDTNTIVGQPITTPDGVTLIPISKVSFGFGSGVGYLVAVLVVDEGRRRLRSKDIPHIFRGLPSVLIYIGILSLAIYGLVGTVD